MATTMFISSSTRTHIHTHTCIHTYLYKNRMTAEVEEQISHLRAQHLRSEQEKDLYRIKLEEEKLEREKAQKQVWFFHWYHFRSLV